MSQCEIYNCVVRKKKKIDDERGREGRIYIQRPCGAMMECGFIVALFSGTLKEMG